MDLYNSEVGPGKSAKLIICYFTHWAVVQTQITLFIPGEPRPSTTWKTKRFGSSKVILPVTKSKGDREQVQLPPSR